MLLCIGGKLIINTSERTKCALQKIKKIMHKFRIDVWYLTFLIRCDIVTIVQVTHLQRNNYAFAYLKNIPQRVI